MRNILQILLIILISLFFFIFFLKESFIYYPPIQIMSYKYTNLKDLQIILNEYHYFNGNQKKLDSEYLYSYSFLPVGYLRFKKTGSTVEYYLSNHQLFWVKDSFSYPYTEPDGKFIFFINSDRTKVEVVDKNNQQLFIANGNFLVDIKCNYFLTHLENYKNQYLCFILFSDGQLLGFSESFFKRFDLRKSISSFYKSLSCINEELQLHFYSDGKDRFSRFKVDFKQIESGKIDILLNQKNILSFNVNFPYTIPFVMTDDKVIFPHFDRFFSMGKQSKEIMIERKTLKENTLKDSQEEIELKIGFLGNLIYKKKLIILFYNNNLVFFDNSGNIIFFINLKNVLNLVFYDYKNKVYAFTESGFMVINI